MKKLTAKENQFCLEYVKLNEGNQAAINAKYAPKSARITASKLLTKTNIQERIKELRSEQEERTLVTADFVILGLKEVAERCMQRVPVMYFNKAYGEMKQETVMTKDVNGEIREDGVWEFDSAGANRALELLGKYKGLFDRGLDEALKKSKGKITVSWQQ